MSANVALRRCPPSKLTRPRLLAFVRHWPPRHRGGDSVFARDLLVSLAAAGAYQVLVVTSGSKDLTPNPQSDDQITLANVSPSKDIGAQLEAQGIHTLDFAVIIAFQARAFVDFESFFAATEAPVVYSCQLCFMEYRCRVPITFNIEPYLAAESQALARANAIVFPSFEEQRRCKEHYDLVKSKTTCVIPNGLRIPRSLQTSGSPAPPSRDTAIRFGMAGRLEDPMKGAPIFLRAIDLLPEEARCRGRFSLLGNRGHLLEGLRRAPGVVLGRWVSSRRGYYSRLAELDFLVVPSLYEPFGMVCLEAMALGVVPLVADHCGLLKLVSRVDPLLAFKTPQHLLDAESILQLRDRIIWGMDLDCKSLQALGRISRRTVSEHYSIEIIAARYAQFLKIVDCKRNGTTR